MTIPLSPDERAKLQLAPGSKWEGDAIIDDHGARTDVGQHRQMTPWISLSDGGEDPLGAWIPDVLAVIRAAGLDPEHTELVRLREAVSLAEVALDEIAHWRKKSHEYDEDMVREHRVFDEEDLQLAETYATEKLEALRKLVKP